MNREQYFEELRIALRREEFSVLPEQGGLLPVEWDGAPLCRVTEGAGVRYAQEDTATVEREQACKRVSKLAGTVMEYLQRMEQAPRLKAQSLTGDYRTLAEFNGTVLAGNPTGNGVVFVTWDWSCDHTGLNNGHYYQENYEGAKQDFAVRSGLIDGRQLFDRQQLTEIYRCCADTLDNGYDLTREQKLCIRSVQAQIESRMPDIVNQIGEQRQDTTNSYSQELTM